MNFRWSGCSSLNRAQQHGGVTPPISAVVGRVERHGLGGRCAGIGVVCHIQVHVEEDGLDRFVGVDVESQIRDSSVVSNQPDPVVDTNLPQEITHNIGEPLDVLLEPSESGRQLLGGFALLSQTRNLSLKVPNSFCKI
jgi:hypothetical protein